MAPVAALLSCLWLELQPGTPSVAPKPPVATPKPTVATPKPLAPADQELLQNLDFIHFLELKEQADWLVP